MNIKRKIGMNRGKARIWIEGPALADAGWVKGKPYFAYFVDGAIFYHSNTTEALRAAGNPRKVAGDPARPIIDTNTDKILDALGAKIGDTVNIEITPDSITIIKA